MRCNVLFALAVVAFGFVPAAHAQQNQAAPTAQLKAPGHVNVAKQPDPAGAAPNGAPAAAGNAAASAAIASGAAPSGAPVLTLGQAAGSAPTSATPPMREVPDIKGNSELATGAAAKQLDAAAPRTGDGATTPPPQPEIVLVRISYSDSDLRALLRVHGVSRFVQIGDKVKEMVVSNISEDGVCLVDVRNPDKKSKKSKSKNAKPNCTKTIQFQR